MDDSISVAPVNLVRTERVPGQCGVVLRGQVQGVSDGELLYFQTSCTLLSLDLELDESIVSPRDGCVLVPVRNSANHVIKIDHDVLLGEVYQVVEKNGELMVNGDVDEDTEMPPGVVQHVRSTRNVKLSIAERQRKLSSLLVTDRGHKFNEVTNCALKYHDVFSLDEGDRGAVTCVEHVIETDNHPPIRQLPCDKISSMVMEMLDTEVIQESSNPWASPVVMVRKKDNTLRFCVDYRMLNSVTRKDTFPLPRIDDLLDHLKGKSVFSTLDAKQGYWQIPVSPDDREKTAFMTHDGLYEFRVMPFGLCNAPATFERLMQRILSGLSNICNVYIDDILIFSRSVEEHIDHLL